MLKEECQEILDRNPFAGILKIKLLEVEEGMTKAKIPFQQETTNVYGDFHGGALFVIV